MAIDQIAPYLSEMRGFRHDIHQHPELGFEETRTSALVAEALRSWGYTVETGVGKTGVVGQLKTAAAANVSACVQIWMPCRFKRRPAPSGKVNASA